MNIHQIIFEGGGISGFINGILIIAFLYLLGFPLLYVINAVRVYKNYGRAAVKERCLKVTKESINTFIAIGGISVFFAVPLSLIPVGIALSIISFVLNILFSVPFGKYSIEIIIAYAYVALIAAMIYAVYKSIKETNI